MSEPTIRIVVVLGTLGIALLVALVARGAARRRAGRVRLDLSGLRGRVVFFTSSVCRGCAAIRADLDALEVDYTEIAYEREPETHRRVGVVGVPLVVVRDDSGREVARLAGRASRRRLEAVIGQG